MNERQQSEVSANSKSYTLITGEYIGTKTIKYLFTSELRSDTGTTHFLLGIPNPVLPYATSHDVTPEGITKFLPEDANGLIVDFLEQNDWKEGSTYYGELMEDGKFHIGSEKPGWEDGNWGQKIK